MEGMEFYSKAAVERAMKVQEVILRAVARADTLETTNCSRTCGVNPAATRLT